jgi:hypothetical protein
LDHLLLDQDAIPTLVEVKRSSNREIRRLIVGQMLDYAANAVTYWNIESLRAAYEEHVADLGGDPEDAIAGLVDDPEVDYDEFWERAKTNLRAGRIRLVFVADTIPTELQRVVEFLNERMSPTEVLAVEIRQYTGGGEQTLVPRVLGQTAGHDRNELHRADEVPITGIGNPSWRLQRKRLARAMPTLPAGFSFGRKPPIPGSTGATEHGVDLHRRSITGIAPITP